MKMKCILLFLIIFIFTACKKDTEEEVIRAVKIQEINSMQDENFNIDFPAQISSTQKTVLAFKYAGKIKSINFESGDFVKKGQVIATIDDKDYKVNLEAFSKKYEAAKAVAQNAEIQFTRAEKLYKGEALAKKDYDNALMQKNVAISTFKEASAGLENARNTLNDTKIIAPYDGYIDKKVVEVGTVVPEGGPVISFISNEITDISVNASSKDIEYIKNANDIIFKDNSSEKIYPLKVKSVAQNPDSINLTYPVIFTFSNLSEGENFLSGQTGTVTINVKNNGNPEILIPLNAVFEDNGSNVYLFKNGIAVKTPIEIRELRETDKISVVRGLKSGDKVIVAGISKLTDGEKVRILGGNK
ncbi:efflux RND transporter periplasmic adaptor subunit [Fusobacterium nucleatum]|uniref:efflux RND transporter periplasmic adaptor subunit n=1 Tax=Fusobacterium nucleatum TaxID=851 RepID=UPI0030CFCD9D